jgi:DNA-binding NtrC family response regulator
LVVDDEPTVRNVIARALSDAGFDVTPAADALEAIRRIVEHGPRVRVALVDLVLPHQSGWDILRWLRRAHPDVQLVAMTGSPEIPTPPDFHPPCAVVQLAKPFDPDEVVAAVRRASGGHPAVP